MTSRLMILYGFVTYLPMYTAAKVLKFLAHPDTLLVNKRISIAILCKYDALAP